MGLAKYFLSSYNTTEYLGTNEKMAKTSKKPKMGRPPLSPEKRKRPSMGFRPTAEMRRKLEDAAGASGLSLTQEIERRLERSLEEDEALGGRQFRAMFSLFGNAAVLIEQQTGKSCFKDWNTWAAVQEAWKSLGVIFRPLPSKAWRKALLEASKATPVAFSKPPPEDAELGVRMAYLKEVSKASHALYAFHRYQEDDRVQEEFGREIAATLLPKKPEKES